MYASFRIALVMSIIGKVSAKPTLTITNDQTHLECGTIQTVLTCELQSPTRFTIHWRVDGVYVSECSTLSCDRKDEMSTNYNTTAIADGRISKFYISPVDIFDNKTFECIDTSTSNYINITTEEVKINKSLTTITNKTVDNNVVFNVITSCVFHPGAVNISVESKKVNGNGGFTSFPVKSMNTTRVCTNKENAYCGGNKTNILNINFTISTDTNGGEMYQFKLHIIQTLENGSKYTITFENDEIGQLKLQVPIPQESQGKVPIPLESQGKGWYVLIGIAVFVYGAVFCICSDRLGLKSWIKRIIPWRHETIFYFCLIKHLSICYKAFNNANYVALNLRI